MTCLGQPNSIIILDFDTLNVLFVKNLDQQPINLIKVLKKIDKNNEETYNEGLVFCLGHGEQNKIVLFEKQ